MNSTTRQRELYAPPCESKHRLEFAYRALDTKLKKYNYAPKEGQTWGYNCRKITGGSGHSLHSYKGLGLFEFWNGVRVTMAIAVDINSLANPYGPRLITDMPRNMIEEILAIRTNNGRQVWGWGGNYRNNKDAMHFEIVCDPADLATGIRETNPQQKEEEIVMELFTRGNTGTTVAVVGDKVGSIHDWQKDVVDQEKMGVKRHIISIELFDRLFGKIDIYDADART